MDKLKIVLRVITFCIIGIILFWILQNIFIPKTEYSTIIREFYEEPQDSLDVLFMGDSSIYRGISPMQLWKEYGYAGYDFSSPAQKKWDEYYCLKEAIQYQSPKLVVINAENLFDSSPMKNEYQRHLYDNMKFGKNKIDAIRDPQQKISTLRQLSFVIPLLRFHDRWKKLTDVDFKGVFDETYHSKVVFKGCWLGKNTKAYNVPKNPGNQKNNLIAQNAGKYLEKIKVICDNNNIELMLLYSPSPKKWSEEQHENVQKWANSNNVKFLDVNEHMDEVAIDWKKDTFDGGDHLNVSGAYKLTSFVGKFINANYSLPNHKNDENYQSWNEEFVRYEEFINKKEAKHLTNQ